MVMVYFYQIIYILLNEHGSLCLAYCSKDCISEFYPLHQDESILLIFRAFDKSIILNAQAYCLHSFSFPYSQVRVYGVASDLVPQKSEEITQIEHF